jgi:hypothetical protein
LLCDTNWTDKLFPMADALVTRVRVPFLSYICNWNKNTFHNRKDQVWVCMYEGGQSSKLLCWMNQKRQNAAMFLHVNCNQQNRTCNIVKPVLKLGQTNNTL